MVKGIETALHIRSLDQALEPDGIFKHLEGFYDSKILRRIKVDRNISLHVNRLYLGDEFCSHRLSDLNFMREISQFARENRLELTILTPVLTDREMDRYTPLFDYLNEFHKNVEVVVNDMGVILFLKENFPLFRLAAGRLLNKAFKDPRLTDAADLSLHSGEAETLLNECTFDNEEFHEIMAGLEVERLERDLLPYGKTDIEKISGMKTSVYFPFGFITTGRICWISTFNQPEGSWFMPQDRCTRPCDALTLDLNNDNFTFQVVQSGNTVFYLYPSGMLTTLFEMAKTREIRLVYQGFVI